MSRSTGKPFTVYSALCKVMYMLPCKYKKRSLSLLFLILEALSIVIDQFGKTKLLLVLAAFLLSALGFAITLVNCVKRNAKPQKTEQLEVVEFVFSLIQLVATFLHFALTVSNVKYNYNLSMFFPLAFAVIAVIFDFKNDGEHCHSQSRYLPITNLPPYNSEPGSSHNESDQIRIIIPTPNNSMPASTPIEPDGQIWNFFDEENEGLEVKSLERIPDLRFLKFHSSRKLRSGTLESLLVSLRYFPFLRSAFHIAEPKPNITLFNYPIELYFDKDHWLYTKLSWQTEGLKESEKQLIKEILHITEPQAGTHLRVVKPVTNPVADVFGRPFTTVRRRKNFQHQVSVAEST